jgi:predicted transposase YbfD/YdcC
VIERVPLAGNVVTGDALYCQHELCRRICEAGGDYVVIVKANQRELYQAIELLFREPPAGEHFRSFRQYSHHGDRGECRRLWLSTALNQYLSWPRYAS